MRNYLELIEAILGGHGNPTIEKLDSQSTCYFDIYKTILKDIKGIPPVWYFAILQFSDTTLGIEKLQEIFRNVNKIIQLSLNNKFIPLVVISDNQNIRLSQNFKYSKESVFVIDGDQLTGKSSYPKNIRNAPIFRIIRNKFSQKDLSFFIFSPYTPNKPASGWRFFGRKRELEYLINTEENYFVVGSRRIGKTSLLQECMIRLNERGEEAIYIPVQHLLNASEVVNQIALKLNAQELYHAKRKAELLDEKFLMSVLRSLKGKKRKITLILDELGNIISKNLKDDWSIIGILRDFSHNNQIRILASGFQEFWVKQINEFEGPLVNFATTMKLKDFTDLEIQEFIIDPLSFWGELRSDEKLIDSIINKFGRHPFVLQYLGRFIFEKMFEFGSTHKIDIILELCLKSENISIFENPVDEMFWTATPIERYIYLKRCLEGEMNNEKLINCMIDDSWLTRQFELLEIKSTYIDRRLFLERLELHGLTGSVENNVSRQRISSPIIYTYIKMTEPDIKSLVDKFAIEAKTELLNKTKRNI